MSILSQIIDLRADVLRRGRRPDEYMLTLSAEERKEVMRLDLWISPPERLLGFHTRYEV